MSAEIHAKIAKRVYPDALVLTHTWEPSDLEPLPFDDYVTVESEGVIAYVFTLLDVENGVAAFHSKASALDVLVWLINEDAKKDKYNPDVAGCAFMLVKSVNPVARNPCAAIYEAAKEIVSHD